MAKQQQGAGLAEAVTSVAVQVEGVLDVVGRLVEVRLVEVDAGQVGEGLTFEDPESGLAGKNDSVMGARQGLIVAAEVLVCGGQPDEGSGFGVAGLDLASQAQGLLVVLDGLGRLGEALVDCAQGIQGVGLVSAMTGLAGQG